MQGNVSGPYSNQVVLGQGALFKTNCKAVKDL